jgi:hypothetical protein
MCAPIKTFESSDLHAKPTVRTPHAIVSEFSTASRDELDMFRDPEVRRATNIRD